jgi:hypothetical protein
MANEPPRSDHSDRDKRDRIARLKQRVDDALATDVRALRNVLKGVLDLLADEL